MNDTTRDFLFRQPLRLATAGLAVLTLALGAAAGHQHLWAADQPLAAPSAAATAPATPSVVENPALPLAPTYSAIVDRVAPAVVTVREQMELHRANPVCSSCHTKMDPLGFSLENFNAVGAWRASDAGKLLDVSAVMPDGTKFDGPTGSGGLQGILLSRKDQFTDAFVERLMTYALGRGLEAPDMPAVRKVRYAAAKDNYRMRTVIMGIIQSVPFSMRRTPQT